MDTLKWLLESDPALAWQAMRDLTDTSAAEIASVRSRIPHEGTGAEILQLQQADGTWRCDGAPAWLTTLFTMQMLRATGIDPADPAVEAAISRIDTGVRWNNQGGRWDLRPAETGGNTFFQGEAEPCINGGALAAGAYFRRPSEELMHLLLDQQLEDGGWNCEAPKSARSSFHTTICVLEGLLEYERAVGPAPEVSNSRRKGEEYLLQRSLFRRLSTGDVVDPKFLDFAFPPRYRYDVLRALDYFRATGSRPDARTAEAVEIVRGKRQMDGRWLLDAKYDKGFAVPSSESGNEPSRWNTLRALRILRWHEQVSRTNASFAAG